MSTFNTAQMETDRMMAPVQMEAGRRRNEGISNIGNAAAGAAGQFMQGQELAIRDAEAATRIASWQQEQDLNAIKMQQILSLDAAMQSRHQTTLAQVQADSAMLEFQERKQALQGKKQQFLSESMEYGLVVGGEMDESGKFQKWDPEEHKARMERYNEMRRPRGSFSPYLEESRMARLANELEGVDPQMAESLRRKLGERLGGGQGAPAPDAPAATKAPPEQVTPRQFAIVTFQDPQKQAIAMNALNAEQWNTSPTWSKFQGEDREILSAGIADYVYSLVRMQGEGRGRSIDPNIAHEMAMKAAENDPALMGYLLFLTKDSDEEIGMKLKTLFPDRDGAVNSAMKLIPAYRAHFEKK